MPVLEQTYALPDARFGGARLGLYHPLGPKGRVVIALKA